MTAARVPLSTSHNIYSVFVELVEGKLVDEIQVRYHVANEGVETLLFNLVEEGIVTLYS